MRKSNPSTNPIDSNRNALFQQSDASNKPGRAWGVPQETPETENLDNSQILQLQRNIMTDQDQALDSLANVVSRQKEIALEINKEVGEHNRLLDELDVKVDSTGVKIRNATRRVQRVAEKASAKSLWVCICVLVLLLIVVGFLALYT